MADFRKISDFGDTLLAMVSQAVPRLQRPVLCVPGGTSQRFGLRPVLRHLSDGDQNQVGGVYHVGRRAEFERRYKAQPGNLFTIEFSRTFGSVERNATEIGLAVEDIKRLTGASQVDVVSDCRGGIDAREYVRQGGSGIRN